MSPAQRLALALFAFPLAWSATACSKPATESAAPSAPVAELPAEVAAVAASLSLPAVEPAAATPVPPAATSGVITTTGELVAPMTSELVTRQIGRVAEVLVDEGDTVRAGQPLLRIESDYQALEVQRLEAEVLRVRAALAEAERDLARKQSLLSTQSIPQAVADRSLATRDQAAAAVAATESALALARQKLEDTVLRAPFSGVVSEQRADVGERLSEATVAFVLMQLHPLRLRFELPERELSRVRRGAEVTARVEPFPNEVFRGRVRVLAQTVDPSTRSFFVEAELDNRDGRLRPGLFARVELVPEG
jgi:membrane fusion protein, multidrug efflux system